MGIASRKITAFDKLISELGDKPNAADGLSAAELKAWFDSSPEELRVKLNGLIDDLLLTTDGNSGADNIGATAISGLTGATVQAIMEALKNKVDSINPVAGFVNVTDATYGAKGDGVADDTAAIQAAHDALSEGDMLYIPPGDFLVNGVNFYKKRITILCLGNFQPLDTSTPYVVQLGSPDKTVSVLLKGNITVEVNSDWFTYPNTTAIRFLNVQDSILTVSTRGTNIGLEFIGDGTGCVYNKIFIHRLKDHKTSLKATCLNNGWANENTLYGGNFTNLPGKLNYDGVCHIDLGVSDYWTQDAWVFYKPCFEGTGNVVLFRPKTQGCKIMDARIETTSPYNDGFITFESGSKRNYVSTLSDTCSATPGGQITLNHEATWLQEGRIRFADTLGNLTKYFPKGRFVTLELDDASRHDTLVIQSTYSAGIGSTLFLTQDIPTGRTVTGFTVSKIHDSGTENVFDPYKKGQLQKNGGATPSTNNSYFSSYYMPAIAVGGGNISNNEIALLLSKLGELTYAVDISGNISTKGEYTCRTPSKGVVITTPDGTKKYRIRVDNAGAIVTELVT